MSSTSTKQRSKSSSREKSRSKPSGSRTTPRSLPMSRAPQTPSSNGNVPRRHNSMDFASHPHFQQLSKRHHQSMTQQSRNSSPTQRSANAYKNNRRAHFETMSDTASAASSSTSPSGGKTVMSDGGNYPSLAFRAPSPGAKSARSARSDTSSAIVRKNKVNNVKKVIEGLNKSISDEKRIVAITNACSEFDHWDEARHNAELQHGAADALTMYLSNTEDENEIRLICAALEMIYRASADRIKQSFAKVGSSIVPLLLKLLERYDSEKLLYSKVVITSNTKILLIFSRVPDLRHFLARQRGLFDAVKRVSTADLDDSNRVLRVRLLANLANCDANKVLILQHPGLLEALLRVAALDSNESAREFAGLSIMDLAAEPKNQVKMARVDKLLGTLVKLAVLENIPDTRESAVTALQNLAYAKQNRVRLVTYGSGVVVEALKKVVGSDKDSKARRRAAGALTNLACDETGERMGSHKGLLDTLAQVSTRDESADVQQRAAMALTKIASSVPKSSPTHKSVLDALVTASDSPHAVSSIVAIMRVKTRDSECRESMAFHPGVLDMLADISMKAKLPLKDRDNAMRSIMHLTNEARNCKVMCCKKILKALVQGVSSQDEEISTSAITAMERLATDFSNRPHMARHEGLLTAVAMATEREAKMEAATSSSSSSSVAGTSMSSRGNTATGNNNANKSMPLLAKPLLMSLLVAM